MKIRITVDQTPPPQGTLTDDAGQVRPFAGWLELLATLEAAVGSGVAPGRQAGQLPLRAAAQLGEDVGYVGLDSPP